MLLFVFFVNLVSILNRKLKSIENPILELLKGVMTTPEYVWGYEAHNGMLMLICRILFSLHYLIEK